jgi:hypothetical protein
MAEPINMRGFRFFVNPFAYPELTLFYQGGEFAVRKSLEGVFQLRSAGPHCQRRVGGHCGVGKWFLCRHCYRLPYASQQQSYADRMADQARKVWKRLGASMSLLEPVRSWHKPKGMHWHTFARLTAREKRYYQASLSVLRAWLNKEKFSRE